MTFMTFSFDIYTFPRGFPGGSVVKNPPANARDARDRLRSLSWEDALEEGMATHSSILAWRIPWTEEPGGLQSMGSQRVTTEQLTHTSCRQEAPLPPL